MHIIYTTDAIVLSVETRGEKDIAATVLTKEYGLLRLLVVSGRSETNKHRGHMVRHARVSVNIVHGKTGWRLTGVHDRAPFRHVVTSPTFPIYLKASRLIMKLTGEQDPQPKLYDFFDGLFDQNIPSSEFEVRGFELFVVMHILSLLGYWELETHLTCTTETMQLLASSYGAYVRQINKAIESTHLVSE